MLGLITGSGFYDLERIRDRREEVVETNYGEVVLTHARWDGRHDLVFLARHGTDHSVAPHLINYRANISALHSVGVTAVVATAVSGAIAQNLEPGDLVIIDDFLDFTTGRTGTFFDTPGEVHHTDMTTAYDPLLRSLITQAAEAEEIHVVDGGTYCTFNGPRFESPAEIRMAAALGGDLVGMTGYPEVVLARELGMAYAAIGVISNKAAGLGGDDLSLAEIKKVLESASGPLYQLIGAATDLYETVRSDPEYQTARMFVLEDISASLLDDRLGQNKSKESPQ